MLIGRVIDNQFRDHPDLPAVRLIDKIAHIVDRAVAWIDAGVIGDVVAVVPQRRRIKRKQPDRGHPQFLEIVELG